MSKTNRINREETKSKATLFGHRVLGAIPSLRHIEKFYYFGAVYFLVLYRCPTLLVLEVDICSFFDKEFD